jgi:hypothetical protein
LEFAVLYPFQAGNVGCDLAQCARPAPQKDDLQAVVVINVNVCGCDNGMVVIVLNGCQTVFKISLVMVVHESQHTE